MRCHDLSNVISNNRSGAGRLLAKRADLAMANVLDLERFYDGTPLMKNVGFPAMRTDQVGFA